MDVDLTDLYCARCRWLSMKFPYSASRRRTRGGGGGVPIHAAGVMPFGERLERAPVSARQLTDRAAEEIELELVGEYRTVPPSDSVRATIDLSTVRGEISSGLPSQLEDVANTISVSEGRSVSNVRPLLQPRAARSSIHHRNEFRLSKLRTSTALTVMTASLRRGLPHGLDSSAAAAGRVEPIATDLNTTGSRTAGYRSTK